MPRADYRCPLQPEHEIRDWYFPAALGAVAAAPLCADCEVVMEWIPFSNFDMKSDGDGDKGFQKFDVTRVVPTRTGEQQVTETIDSLHKLRKIEADSEQRYRNGEGEPLRFRGYAQDRSNMDRGAFGTAGSIGDRTYDSGKTPQKKPNISVTRHGQHKPRVPTARRGGVSPLR
jgi:hypothetical protein